MILISNFVQIIKKIQKVAYLPYNAKDFSFFYLKIIFLLYTNYQTQLYYFVYFHH